MLIYTKIYEYEPVSIGKITHFFYGYKGEYNHGITHIFTDKGFSLTINKHLLDIEPGDEVTLHPKMGQGIHFTEKTEQYECGSTISFENGKYLHTVLVMNKIQTKSDYEQYKQSLK